MCSQCYVSRETIVEYFSFRGRHSIMNIYNPELFRKLCSTTFSFPIVTTIKINLFKQRYSFTRIYVIETEKYVFCARLFYVKKNDIMFYNFWTATLFCFVIQISHDPFLHISWNLFALKFFCKIFNFYLKSFIYMCVTCIKRLTRFYCRTMTSN